MKVLINFADNNYKKAQNLNSKTGKLFCKFDKIYNYSPADISKEFLEKNKKIFNYKRGYGLWLWKPYLINETLKDLKDGDVVFYCDSGACFFRNISQILDILELQDIWVSILPLIEKQFTKRKAFELMNLNDEKYKNSNQISGTFLAIKKSEFSMNFVKEWLDYCCNIELISPVEDKSDEEEYFYSHREDQSILSLLIKKYDIKAYSDPSQYGRLPEKYFRDGCQMKYYGHEDYPICILHHRTKDGNINILFKQWLCAILPRKIGLKFIDKK